MDLLFDDDFTEKEYNKYMPYYRTHRTRLLGLSALVTGFFELFVMNKVLIKYTRPHTFLFMSDFLKNF